MSRGVKVGDRAPEFSLPDQSGQAISLRYFMGKRNVVLYFYPKDFTTGCVAEAKTFAENYGVLKGMGAEVVGISSDSIESHREFAGSCRVPFPLLSDEGGKVRRIFGVRSTLGLIPGRVTFVIDKKGIVRHVFSSQFNSKKHVEEAVQAMKSLSDD